MTINNTLHYITIWCAVLSGFSWLTDYCSLLPNVKFKFKPVYSHVRETLVLNKLLSYRVFFLTGTPLKILSTNKLIQARLGVSWPIYVNVDSANIGFPYCVIAYLPQSVNIVFSRCSYSQSMTIWQCNFIEHFDESRVYQEYWIQQIQGWDNCCHRFSLEASKY